MRYAPGHKERTRGKILEAAGRIFRRRGYQGAGVDEVMQQAGLTAGGFYAHFESKETLLGETLGHVAAEFDVLHAKSLENFCGRERLNAFVAYYLSPGHRDNLEGGCPLAALISEVSRAGESVKQSFEAILRDLSASLSAGAEHGRGDDRSLAILALCVGGLGLARSVRDEALSNRILAACRELAKESCSDSDSKTRK